MKNFIKIAIFSLMVFLLASCACNRTNNEPSAPLAFELQEDVTIVSSTDSTEVTLTQGSVVYVYEDDDTFNYNLLLNQDMLDDKEDYGDVIIRMGKINDTQFVGFMDVRKLAKHKRLR